MNKPAVFLAAAFVLLSCSSAPKQEPTTRFSGAFPDGPVPDSVQVQYWTPTDTTHTVDIKKIPVIDGRFEGEIPCDATDFAFVFIPENNSRDIIKFIADGSTLTIDVETQKVTSSDQDGVQSRFNAWQQESIDLLMDIYEAGEDVKDEKKPRKTRGLSSERGHAESGQCCGGLGFVGAGTA